MVAGPGLGGMAWLSTDCFGRDKVAPCPKCTTDAGIETCAGGGKAADWQCNGSADSSHIDCCTWTQRD